MNIKIPNVRDCIKFEVGRDNGNLLVIFSESSLHSPLVDMTGLRCQDFVYPQNNDLKVYRIHNVS